MKYKNPVQPLAERDFVFIVCRILLQPQQYLAVFPQFFQVVEFTLVGREEMHNHVAVIDDQPAVTGDALLLPLFFMVGIDAVDR